MTPMKPMCAFRYKDQHRKLPPTFHVQPKLNGIRMLYNRGICQSRFGKVWHPEKLTHITDQLADIPSNIVLDGELYLHGQPLQEINGAVSVLSREPTPATLKIEYWIFDMLDTHRPGMHFWERFDWLKHNIGTLRNQIVLTPTYECDRLSAEKFHATCLRQKFEGTMYRITCSPYGQAHECTNKDNRWNRLLKRKDFLDGEATVLGTIPGTGKYEEAVGVLLCRFHENNAEFEIGTGFSDAERFRFAIQPPIDSVLRFRYEMLSNDGKPLKPSFESFLDDLA